MKEKVYHPKVYELSKGFLNLRWLFLPNIYGASKDSHFYGYLKKNVKKTSYHSVLI